MTEARGTEAERVPCEKYAQRHAEASERPEQSRLREGGRKRVNRCSAPVG